MTLHQTGMMRRISSVFFIISLTVLQPSIWSSAVASGTCDPAKSAECLDSSTDSVMEEALPEDAYSDFPVYHEVARGSIVAVCVVSREVELMGLKIALLTMLQLQVISALDFVVSVCAGAGISYLMADAGSRRCRSKSSRSLIWRKHCSRRSDQCLP